MVGLGDPLEIPLALVTFEALEGRSGSCCINVCFLPYPSVVYHTKFLAQDWALSVYNSVNPWQDVEITDYFVCGVESPSDYIFTF